MYSHLAQEGGYELCGFLSKGGETLAMGTAVEWRIVKTLSRALDHLPMVVSGGIDGCQIN